MTENKPRRRRSRSARL